jgi:hypothetical protein
MQGTACSGNNGSPSDSVRVQLLYTVQRSRVLRTVTSECICVRLKFQQRPGTPIFCGKMMSELYV